MASTRDETLAKVVERSGVWPLIDSLSCRMCAIPRQEEYHRGYSTCYRCKELKDRYGTALADLFPITYTTREWALGTAVRRFKDDMGCRVDARAALRFGAVMSAYLESQIGRISPRGGFGVVMPVPSSSPTVVRALGRARAEGWWTPDLATDLARVRRGFPRQRDRPPNERGDMDGKWVVDRDSLDGIDVLVLDDILTTGNSLHSFARALRDAGARSVRGVVLGHNVGVKAGEWIRPLLESEVEAGRPWSPGTAKRDVIR